MNDDQPPIIIDTGGAWFTQAQWDALGEPLQRLWLTSGTRIYIDEAVDMTPDDLPEA